MATSPEQDRGEEEISPVKRGTYMLWAAGALLFAAAFFACGFVFARLLQKKTDTASPVETVMGLVRTRYYYYGDETEKKLTEGALRGIAAYLDDPYAYYYTPEEYAALQQGDSGTYTGIGIVVSMREDGACVITEVYENAPGAAAGLRAGDIILSVNGTETAGLDLNGVCALFRVAKGEENLLIVARGEETLSCTAIAEEVYKPYVHFRMLDARTGYIHISGFHGKVTGEVRSAVSALQEQGMDRLVIDVRDDPGGMLYDVCDIADIFLPEGCVVTTLKSRGGGEKVYRTKQPGLSLPIAVLVNGDSASASELLAGALRDNGAAVIFGTKTYGKGVVQTYYELQSGAAGAFKMTTEAYFTPADVCIQDIGIMPDHIVEMPEDLAYAYVYELTTEEDPQLRAALEYLNSM